jgi:hypothetical protein
MDLAERFGFAGGAVGRPLMPAVCYEIRNLRDRELSAIDASSTSTDYGKRSIDP